MEIQQEGQILQAANNYTESQDEVNEVAEVLNGDVDEDALDNGDVDEIADDLYDGADEESFLEDMADTEEMLLDETNSDEPDAEKEARLARMRAGAAKRAKVNQRTWAARGNGDVAAGKAVKLQYEPGKVKRAAKMCQDAVLKPCTAHWGMVIRSA
jgi:hypothetical protein